MIPFIAFLVITGLAIWGINGLFKALQDFDD